MIDRCAPNSRLFSAARPLHAAVASASPEPASQYTECIAAFLRGGSLYAPLLKAAHGLLECAGRLRRLACCAVGEIG